MRAHSHGQRAQATQGVNEGMGEWTKVQAIMQAYAAVDEGVRVHETWPMA